MSTMINSVMLIGRPTADAQPKDGKVQFDLVVNERYMQDGHLRDRSYTFPCVCEKESIKKRTSEQVKKGRRIAIDGCLRNNDYEDGFGEIHTYTWVEVTDLFIIEK